MKKRRRRVRKKMRMGNEKEKPIVSNSVICSRSGIYCGSDILCVHCRSSGFDACLDGGKEA